MPIYIRTKDLTGEVFGELTVIKMTEVIPTSKWDSKNSKWLCLCSCGKEVIKNRTYLHRKDIKLKKSCGCLNKITKRYNFVDLI